MNMNWLRKSCGRVLIALSPVVAAGTAMGNQVVDSNDALVHRWGFNGSLVDSVGGQTATTGGSVSYADNAAVTLPGGNTGAGWIDLGANVLPKDGSPVTIEIWARQNSVKNWARIFDIHGGNNQNDFYMAWSKGMEVNEDQVELKTSNTVRWQIQNVFAPYTLGTEYLIVATLEPNYDGKGNARYTFRKIDASTGDVLKSTSRDIADSNGSPAKLLQSNFWLGHSIYGDNDAAATYNEVRVWKRLLTEAELKDHVLAGVDGIERAKIGTVAYCKVANALTAAKTGETVEVLPGSALNVVPCGTTAGALTFAEGAKLCIDLANFSDAAVLTAAGGISLPVGASIADVISFSSADFTPVLSGDGKSILAENLTIPVTATWTGGGETGNLNDPANWECRNSQNDVIAYACPNPEYTTVTISGETTFRFPASVEANWKSLVIDNCSLTADCDWSGLDFAAFSANVTVDLNGHKLTLRDGFHGTAATTCTFTDTTTGGELHLAVPEGMVFRWPGASLTGNLTLVKEGDGLLELGSVASTCAMEIKAGMVNDVPAPAFDLGTFLAHRWSFNGNLTDSVGGQTATTGGSVSYADNAAVTLPGGNTGAGWVNLGANVLPKDGSPVTIEIWARQNSSKSWARIFDIHGGNNQNDFYMAWSNGTDVNKDQVELKADNTVRWQIKDAFAPYTLGTEYLIVATLEPNYDGKGNTRYTFRKIDASTGDALKSTSRDIADSNGSPAKLLQSNFWLGHSIYGDNDAAASYNEVRVWKAALTDNILKTHALAGADAASFATVAAIGGRGYFSHAEAFAAAGEDDTVSVLPSADPRPIAIYGKTAGKLAFESGAKLYIDLANLTDAAVLTAAGGITLPDGASISGVIRFSNTDFTPELSEDGKSVLAVNLTIPVTATWVGNGAADNMNDPKNWKCLNSYNDVIDGACPSPEYTTVMISGETSFNFPASASANWKTLVINDCSLTADRDWSGLDFAAFSANVTVDLNGHKLTLRGFHGTDGSTCTFTDTTKDGELHLAVPEGMSFNWPGASLTGNLTLVKEGDGLLELGFIAPSCATEIAAGMVNGVPAPTFDASEFLAHRWSFNGDLTDSVGGQTAGIFGDNASVDASQLVLKGGTKGTSYANLGQGLIPVEGPVTIELWAKKTDPIANNGRLIDIGSGADNFFYMAWNNAMSENTDDVGWGPNGQNSPNKLQYAKDTYYHISVVFIPQANNTTIVKWSRRDVATGENKKSDEMTMNWMPSLLGANANFYLGHTQFGDNDVAAFYDEVRVWKAALTEEQLMAHALAGADSETFGTAATIGEKGYFTVASAFAAAGSTDVVSVRPSAVPSPIAIYGKTAGKLAFEDGAKLRIDLRDLDAEDVLTAEGGIEIPEGKTIADVVEFSFAVFTPALSEDGKSILAVNRTIPVSATWIGGGATVAVTDPKNWQCLNARGGVIQDAIPNLTYTKVTIAGETTFSCPTVADVIWKSLVIEDCSLMANCDWSGLGQAYDQKGKVTLNGHNLTITGFPTAGEFTDTAEKGGELHVNVASATDTLTNEAIPLTGTLVFVKDGPGVFEPAKTGQTYTGGSRIAGGTVRLTVSMSDGTMGADDTEIQIDKDGFLDSNATFDNYNHLIVLNGGTLGNKNATRNRPYEHTHFGNVRLISDSSMDFATGGLVGKNFDRITLDLQGHTLTWYGRDSIGGWCWLNNVTMTAGKVIVTGYLSVFHNTNCHYGIDASAATIELGENVDLVVDTDTFIMGDYICKNTMQPTHAVIPNPGTIEVLGRFKPETDSFWGCKLKDGATLDISTRTAPFTLRSDVDSADTPKDVTFADNATITIDIGDRWGSSKEPIVKWTTPPDNLAGLKFKLKQNNGHGHIVVRPDGLYVSHGTVILFK